MQNENYDAIVERLRAMGDEEAAEALETLDAALDGLYDVMMCLPTSISDFFTDDKETYKQILIARGNYDELDEMETDYDEEDEWLDDDGDDDE